MSLAVQPQKPGAPAHICCLYHSDDDRRDVVREFVRAGIDRDERVYYLSDKPQDARVRLRGFGLDIPADGKPSQIVIASAIKTYCPSGGFKAAKMMATLRRLYDDACKEGCKGARVAAEMSWALRRPPGFKDLANYEAHLARLLETRPMALLCQYDMERFDGATGFEMLGVHSLVVMGRQVVPNPY